AKTTLPVPEIFNAVLVDSALTVSVPPVPTATSNAADVTSNTPEPIVSARPLFNVAFCDDLSVTPTVPLPTEAPATLMFAADVALRLAEASLDSVTLLLTVTVPPDTAMPPESVTFPANVTAPPVMASAVETPESALTVSAVLEPRPRLNVYV